MSYLEALRRLHIARANYEYTRRGVAICRENGWEGEAESLTWKLRYEALEWRRATAALRAARKAHSVVS